MCERVPLSDSLTRLSLCVRESLRPYAIEFRRQLLRPLGWAEGGAEAGSVRTCMPQGACVHTYLPVIFCQLRQPSLACLVCPVCAAAVVAGATCAQSATR